jgi:hypothetical protein
MNKLQRQTILGTLLGYGFITKPKLGKNYFLTIPEKHDKNWLAYKAHLIDKTKKTFIQDSNRWVWRSRCREIWNDMYAEFYESGKKIIKMPILDQLFDIALATWFLDKGYFIKDRICLRTTVFGWEGNQTIHRYFNEVGISCKLRKERETGKILFTKEGTQVFLNTIVSQIPKFMLYRLKDPNITVHDS